MAKESAVSAQEMTEEQKNAIETIVEAKDKLSGRKKLSGKALARVEDSLFSIEKHVPKANKKEYQDVLDLLDDAKGAQKLGLIKRGLAVLLAICIICGGGYVIYDHFSNSGNKKTDSSGGLNNNTPPGQSTPLSPYVNAPTTSYTDSFGRSYYWVSGTVIDDELQNLVDDGYLDGYSFDSAGTYLVPTTSTATSICQQSATTNDQERVASAIYGNKDTLNINVPIGSAEVDLRNQDTAFNRAILPISDSGTGVTLKVWDSGRLQDATVLDQNKNFWAKFHAKL
jgi:hypothetical protein